MRSSEAFHGNNWSVDPYIPVGLLGPKRALLGAPGVLKGPPEGTKHMLWMRSTQAHYVEVFLTLVGPSQPSPGLKRGQKGPRSKKIILLVVKFF